MNIASVIVDVPAKQTDRAFDYLIPEKWLGVVQPGMRVVVPFGPRKVQGFVIAIKSESEFAKLKQILSILDISPVLNKELLDIGFWLTETTLCYAISAFQAMLPTAMKVKYEKDIILSDDHSVTDLHGELQSWFKDTRIVSWGDIEKSDLVKHIQKGIHNGILEVVYRVKDRARKKVIRQIEPALSPVDMQVFLEKLTIQANKQKEVLNYMIENPQKVAVKQLLENISANDSSIKSLVDKGVLKETKLEVYRDPFEDKTFKQTSALKLTEEQTAAITPILKSVNALHHDVFLMYGVTGSGKTEVYMQAIDSVLKQGREGIVLVPEISLTPQMVNRFKGRFGSQVAVLHSGLSTGEKYDEWRKIHRKEVRLVVGARSAIFAPFENLGIIIIDEEHETSYKQEDNPRYHARDVAIQRGKFHKCPIVLGSATPTLESFARASKKVYKLLTLKKRMNDRDLPKVEVIDMREELRNGNRSMFSALLFEKIQEKLDKREQSVLFLNKRGYSSFVMCRDCGYVMNCPHCDISLTYHRSNQRLKCHYCGYEEHLPSVCPECNSDYIRFFGTGTQKVEEELAKIFPEARVIRMDVDTTSRKGAHEKLLTEFGEGRADILLGTQMIAKGLDFPNVTLVGVLTADTMLHLPDFRASEKTFQLLTQVSGRAGRHELPGEVVIQTYTPEHYSVTLASKHDFDHFYLDEMRVRKAHAYPPFYFLTLVTVSHPELTKVVAITEKITAHLRNQLSASAIILGPVASPIPRINDRYRYQCMVKYKLEPNLTSILKKIVERYQQDISKNQLTLSIDLNPYMLM
ncbi:primosomal protein N' [Cytobacillus sp. S13-E01]|uniref:primosomal protein N' n=1 Tax=Cytobacillus sp. S13-E01 TaxID=3031326 RepID=UPI0023D8A4FF|nr:primosomal protein N' [Cytobacillus sp. S13-E01]MDF0725238.1 primosomal protein N' [Cytobacillus sp. S13-E01]